MKIEPGMTFTRQDGNVVTVVSVKPRSIVYKTGNSYKELTPKRFAEKLRIAC